MKQLDPVLRERAISVYREQIPEADKEWVRQQYRKYGADWSVKCGWHFYGGMTARNILREAGLYDNMTPTGNWDDYYADLIILAVLDGNEQKDKRDT